MSSKCSPRNILVTGATGFIGRRLVHRLEQSGNRVHRFARSLGNDILETGAFNPFLDKGVDIVFHLAGRIFVPDSWKNPAEFYAVNTLGTQHVLDFCSTTKARHIFVSAYIYGIPQYLPIDELHPVSPNTPYNHSKWLAEELCRFYAKEMGVRTVVLRPFNLYGPGQSDHFLIPTIVRQARRGDEIIVKDDAPRRDYLHVDDFVDACILSLEYSALPFWVFNVGSEYSVSVREVIETAIRALGTHVNWRSAGKNRKNEIPDTIADCSAIKRALNWRPRMSFEEGIQLLLETEKHSYGNFSIHQKH